MKRIGKYTGTTYDKDYDFSKCPECCVCISDEESEDKSYMAELSLKNKLDCAFCKGCPASMEGNLPYQRRAY